MLDYEKLDVYQRAIEHLAFVFESIPKLPRGWSALVDQWRRAATFAHAKQLLERVVGMLSRMCR